MGNKDIRPSTRTDGKDLKPYHKPTLTKGSVLSDVTAAVAAGSGAAPASDIRLKRDIHPIGRTQFGLTLYRFRYLWSDMEMVGVMAQEVLEVAPEAVITGADGYFRVDYGRLGLSMETLADWQAQEGFAAAA
ncbi:MAG: tail fiber domain-containing protein [Hyphomicrobiales bacterium]|nr:tail fiber domain-containing protein [Hyphomicrobiales bacterium]